MHICQLNQDHEFYFKEQIRKQSPEFKYQFENSWLYNLQAARPSKYVIADDISSLLFARNEYDERVIIPNHRIVPINTLTEMLTCIQDHFQGFKIIIKNVHPSESEKLKATGNFRAYSRSEVWNKFSTYDDQTYPQQIIKLTDIIKMSGTSYKSLRNEIRNCKDLETHPYRREEHYDYVFDILQSYDQTIPGIIEANSIFLLEDIGSIVTDTTGNIVGYYLWEKISTEVAVGLTGIGLRKIKGLTASCQLMAMREAYNQGASMMNIQGSESKNLHRSKQKFSPCLAVRNTHLVFQLASK